MHRNFENTNIPLDFMEKIKSMQRKLNPSEIG